MQSTFRKRGFDAELLWRVSAAAVIHLPVLGLAMLRPTTSPKLREQVMLAVTMVNDCRYCSWAHTGLALAQNVDLEALRQLCETGALDAVEEADAVAILFAKHYADTARQPTAAAWQALARHYTRRQRREIMAYIHAIYFANLSGNSADVWLARLRGDVVEQGHPWAEIVPALLAAPILAAIWVASRRQRPELMQRGRL